MTSYVETKIVALTSQSASIKYNGDLQSNVYYNLGAIYNNDDNIIHTQVQLLNAQIPYSFYVINYTNNVFKYQLGTGTIYTTQIPVGNYTGNSLITALKTALAFNSITLAITLSSITGKLTFVHDTTDFAFYNLANSILPTLGFDSYINPSSDFSNRLVCPYPLNLLGIKTLQIRSSNLIMSNISSVQGGQTTLLATIPVECTPFGMITYSDKGNNLMTIHNDSLDDIQIEIIDGENGNFINFNNQDWCITLAFHITREPRFPSKPSFRSIVAIPLAVGDKKEALPPSNETKPEKTKSEEPPNKDLQELDLLSS